LVPRDLNCPRLRRIEILKIKGGRKPASRCDVKTFNQCSDKEKSYLEKKNKLGKSEIDDEITRLTGLSGKSMSPTQAAWISQRVQLLNKLKQEL